MSDITMCTSNVCALRDQCHRATAKPHEYWQAYGDFFVSEAVECDSFIKTTSGGIDESSKG